MKQINNYLSNLSPEIIWTIKIFAVVFVTSLIHFFVRMIINRAIKKTENTHNLWDDALVFALRRPLRVAIWAIGISFAAQIAYIGKKDKILEILSQGRNVVIIVVIGWFLLRFIKFVEQNILHQTNEKLKLDVMTVGAIAKLLRVAVFITTGLIAMQTLGFSIGGALAFGGIGGMAIGFAAKDMLANFFGALMIYFDRPFKVGDWVRSSDRNIEGTIEEIGWRLTRIRTFDKRPLYVPNSIFTTIIVENPSRMSHRRIYETIGVRYCDISKMGKITSSVKEMLLAHNDIAINQTMIVNFSEFSASSVDFFIYTFTKTTNWIEFHKIKQDVLLRIAAIIEEYGAEIAFPTSTIMLRR